MCPVSVLGLEVKITALIEATDAAHGLSRAGGGKEDRHR